MPRIAVLIVAAGKGERARLGLPNQLGLPKQYERLAGQPMLRRTVEAFRGHYVQVVIGGGQQELAACALAGLDVPRRFWAARRARNRSGWGWRPFPRTRRIMC